MQKHSGACTALHPAADMANCTYHIVLPEWLKNSWKHPRPSASCLCADLIATFKVCNVPLYTPINAPLGIGAVALTKRPRVLSAPAL
jgi:hypothetical protein